MFKNIYYTADPSMLDYPKRISDMLYVKPCNFKCKYCYNIKTLHTLPTETFIPIETVTERLLRGRLSNALTVTGGEPSLAPHTELVELFKKLKEEKEDYKIKVDTNGSNLEFVKEIIPYIDMIAIDIKGGQEVYNSISGKEEAYSTLKEVIKYLYTQKEKVEVVYRWVYYPDYYEEMRKSVNYLMKYYDNEFMNFTFTDYQDFGILPKIEINKEERDKWYDFIKYSLEGE